MLTDEQQEKYVDWIVESSDLDVLMIYMQENLNAFYNTHPDILENEWENDLEQLKEEGIA